MIQGYRTISIVNPPPALVGEREWQRFGNPGGNGEVEFRHTQTVAGGKERIKIYAGSR